VKRCKYRLTKLIPPGKQWSDIWYFTEKANGALGVINGIKAVRARVVIIDTFASFTTIQDGNNYYETTRVIRELKEIADTLQVAVVLVHHTRKTGNDYSDGDWMENIMGSQGLVGAADAIISLRRKRGSADAKLNITGRDITDYTIPIVWNDGLWELAEDADRT
jgi:hypothetical protein